MAVDLSDVNAVIEKNMAAFAKPGVLSVRPGFKVTKDWLTNTKSIVVTVRHKVAHPPQGQMLPAEVGGVPVDVRQASPEKALELEDPQKYAAGLRLAPNLGSVPHFADERTLAGTHPAAAASAHAQLAAIAKPELTLRRPARRDPRPGRGAGDHHPQRQPRRRLAHAPGLPGRHGGNAHRRPVRLHLGARRAGRHRQPGR